MPSFPTVRNLTRRVTEMAGEGVKAGPILLKLISKRVGDELLLWSHMSRSFIGTIVAVTALMAAWCPAAPAQISMQRPGLTGVPQGRKLSAPKQSPAKLTGDEQKRLAAVIKHMKPKDRRKLAKALQKMTPQQRQQLLASVKQQLGKERTAPQPPKRGW
jgi:hypothetical protein